MKAMELKFVQPLERNGDKPLSAEALFAMMRWLRETDPMPAVEAFPAGIEQQIAKLLEVSVLPEMRRLRRELEARRRDEWVCPECVMRQCGG